MNKIVILFILNLNVVFFIPANSFATEYNYYCRNNDGTYILKNHEIPELKMCRYFFVDGKDGELIKGFYYSTEKIKFIDEVENGHIVSSTYYDFGGNVIYQRINYYEGDMMSEYKISLKAENVFFYSVNIFEDNDSNDARVLRSFKVIEQNNSENFMRTILDTTLVFKNNAPVFSKSRSILTNSIVQYVVAEILFH